MKKLISFVLALVLAASLLPVFTFADEVDQNVTVNSSVHTKNYQGLTDIICSLIEAAGVITAAIIGIGGLKKIAKEGFDTYFTNYASNDHDLGKILSQAKMEITIVTAYGDKLLEEYKGLFKSRLKDGIKINYLMLDKVHAFEMAHEYFGGNDKDTCRDVDGVLKALKKLTSVSEKEGAGELEVKIWSHTMAASYIAIDAGITCKEQKEALIQMMIYQYGIETSKAPITYLTYNQNPNQYKNTVKSIQNMWSTGENFSFDEYRGSLRKKKLKLRKE